MGGNWRNACTGLKCVFTSNIDSLANLLPLKAFVSRNVISVSDISAVNLIVGPGGRGGTPLILLRG